MMCLLYQAMVHTGYFIIFASCDAQKLKIHKEIAWINNFRVDQNQNVLVSNYSAILGHRVDQEQNVSVSNYSAILGHRVDQEQNVHLVG